VREYSYVGSRNKTHLVKYIDLAVFPTERPFFKTLCGLVADYFTFGERDKPMCIVCKRLKK